MRVIPVPRGAVGFNPLLEFVIHSREAHCRQSALTESVLVGFIALLLTSLELHANGPPGVSAIRWFLWFRRVFKTSLVDSGWSKRLTYEQQLWI